MRGGRRPHERSGAIGIIILGLSEFEEIEGVGELASESEGEL
jgi:hypothetical protein